MVVQLVLHSRAGAADPLVSSLWLRPTCDQYNAFWISWQAGLIMVGSGNVTGSSIITSYFDPDPLPVNNVTVGPGLQDASANWTVPLSEWQSEGLGKMPFVKLEA